MVCLPLSSSIVLPWAACRWFVPLLADQAMPDAIGYVCMHAWPPIGTTEGAKQLVLACSAPGSCVCLPAVVHGPRVVVHPPKTWARWLWLGEGPAVLCCTCLIHLPQLPKLVSLVHILGQPACPEVVNQRPILSHIGCSPHGYCTLTGLTKPWPIMQMHAARLSSTVSVVAMVAPAAKYHGG